MTQSRPWRQGAREAAAAAISHKADKHPVGMMGWISEAFRTESWQALVADLEAMRMGRV